MMEKQLLFVTYYDKNFDEGLPYAIYLTKLLKKGMTILLIYKKKIMEGFDNLMTAITFAEANEHETARQIMAEGKVKDKKVVSLLEECETAGVDVDLSTENNDAISAIKNFLRQKASVDMVLLNPNVISNENINPKELNRLVGTASIPIVTIAKEVCVNCGATDNIFLNNKERE
jgi:hypothetical protein